MDPNQWQINNVIQTLGAGKTVSLKLAGGGTLTGTAVAHTTQQALLVTDSTPATWLVPCSAIAAITAS